MLTNPSSQHENLRAYAFFTALKIVSERRGEENGELTYFLPAITLCGYVVERRTFVMFGFV